MKKTSLFLYSFLTLLLLTLLFLLEFLLIPQGPSQETNELPKVSLLVPEFPVSSSSSPEKNPSLSIRVLLSGPSSFFHTSLSFSCTKPLILSYGGKYQILPSGEVWDVTEDSPYFSQGVGELYLMPTAPGTTIEVPSLMHKERIPSYAGVLRISKHQKGLLLQNEVSLEEYVNGVLPGEMSPSFEEEALKAQAVCARTYALLQLQKDKEDTLYGADVDDTVSYQVYGTASPSPKTKAAVTDTAGEILGKDGRLCTAYYYSTSCGHSSLAEEAWGPSSSSSSGKLLQSSSLSEEEYEDLSSETVFCSFLKDGRFSSLDDSCPWYRWHTTCNSKALSSSLKSYVEKYGGTYPGTLKKITVLGRAKSGLLTVIQLTGSKGSLTIRGEYRIRFALGNRDLTYSRLDGSTASGLSLLPSAYVSLSLSKGSLSLSGGGYGHGVGMSQNGAQTLALEGYSHEEILRYFYPDASLLQLQDSIHTLLGN